MAASTNRVKKRLDMEDKRQAALKIKHDLEEEKRLYLQEDVYKRYLELEKDRKNAPIVIDLIDLDDMIHNPKLLEDSPNKYGEITEDERKAIFKSLKEDLPILAVDNQRLIKGVNQNIREEDCEKERLKQWSGTIDLLDDIRLNIKKHFQVSTPRYSSYICCCCGRPKQLSDFPKAWNPINATFMDVNGWFHAPWCKECSKKLFEYYYMVKTNKNAELAMEMYCCTTNTYWDIEFFKEAQVRQQNNTMSLHIISEYMGVLNRKKENNGLTYWDSPTIQHRNITIVHGENKEIESKLVYDPDVLEKIKTETDSNVLDVSTIDASENKFDIPMDWDKRDAKNKIKIVKMMGYDPFEYEEENDRKILYKDFLNILELGMENDFTKLQAAIQIVSSFYRIRKMDRTFAERQKDGAAVSELQGISKLKSNELDAITKFTKDHGFAERYAMGKAKGENTLTGVMNRMSNAQYERAILNAYDIKTSKTIQQAADASIKAINDQLSMGESDLYKVIQDQLSVIRDLRKENLEQKEEIRLLNRKEIENKLKEEARKNGALLEEDGDF